MNPFFAFSTRARVHRYTVTGKHPVLGRIELHLSCYRAATIAWNRILERRYSVAGIARELAGNR